MIIELIVGASLVTLGVVAVRSLRREERGEETAPATDTSPASKPKAVRAGPRGLRVDDVLLYADDELWLAGEIHLDEEGFALSLFRTPGSARFGWVAQLDAEAKEVALLAATSEVPDGAVPTELPIGGMRLSLRRRGQAEVSTSGEQLPATTERARYALLEGPGGRTSIVIDFEGGQRLALAGERIGRDLLDLLPGGEAR